MAPPSHTDPIKQRAMQALSATYLSKQAIQEAGLLDAAGVQKILQRHGDANTPVSDRVQLDAIINHMLSVQMLHKHFVGNDVPAVARDRAKERGWYAKDQLVVVGA